MSTKVKEIGIPETEVKKELKKVKIDIGDNPQVQFKAGDKLWVEKYRPDNLENLVGNKYSIELLKNIVENGNMPNLILTGPPGTGKTSSIYALARSLLKTPERDFIKDCLLELNASDDRGIDVVRETIKSFARKKTNLPMGRHKIIILDEADSMTASAQQAMRRTMERCSNSTRFAFSCNDSSKIIEALQSRCNILRYGRLADDQVARKIKEIVQMENLNSTTDGINAIVDTSCGDLRKAINNLQVTACIGKISNRNVYKICNKPAPEIISELIDCCVNKDRISATKFLEELYYNSYSAQDILQSLFLAIKKSETLPEEAKIQFIDQIGHTHMRVTEGSGTLLQLEALVSRLILTSRSLNLK